MTPAYKSLGRRPRAEVLIQREHSVEHGLDAAQMDLLLPLGRNSMAVKILGHDVVDAESANHIRKLMHLRRKALQQGGVATWSRKRGLARVVGVSHGESPSLGPDQHRHARRSWLDRSCAAARTTGGERSMAASIRCARRCRLQAGVSMDFARTASRIS